jgi:hypothetical protein
MATHIAEGPQDAMLVAHRDNRFARNVGCKKAFWISDGAFYAVHFAASMTKRADQLPGAQKNPRFLNIENHWVGIKLGREGLGALDLLIYVELQRLGVHAFGRIRIFWFLVSTSAR